MPEIQGILEYPQDGEKIHGSYTLVQGWTFSESVDDVEIVINIDDVETEKTRTGLPRLDIEKNFPNKKNTYESGFLTSINLWNLQNGKHTLSVIAKTNNSQTLLGNVNFEFKRKKPDSPPPPLFIKRNFKMSGQRFSNVLKELGGLKPEHKVLDVGCSIGRIAMPLTKYLNNEGSYDGFDIVPEAIDWCTRNITPKHPNFRFALTNVSNKSYNPTGNSKASEYKFPYEDDSFDFVFLSSVFTHLLPEDMKNYFSEISRVLKQDGRCVITFLLLNKESLKLVKENKTKPLLPYEFDGFRSSNRNRPEAAIAYDEKLIRELFQKNDLGILEPIHYGRWRGTLKSALGQDIVVAVKH